MANRNVTHIQKNKADGSAPGTADLQLGELAIETSTGTLYLKKDDGTPQIVDVTNDAMTDHLNEGDPHPQYLTPQELPSTAVSWYTDDVSSIDAGYLESTPTEPTDPESTVQATGTTEGVPVQLGQWMREPVFTEDFTWFETTTTLQLDLDCSNTNCELYVEFYKRAADTTETLLSTSDNIQLTSNRQTYTFNVQTIGPFEFVTGDTTVTKIWINKNAGGADPTVTMYMEGNNVSRAVTQIPIPTFPAPHAETHEVGGTDQINHDNILNASGFKSHAQIDSDLSDLQTNKADKVSGAIEQNLAGLDGTGNLIDSGLDKAYIDENLLPTEVLAGEGIDVAQNGDGTITITSLVAQSIFDNWTWSSSNDTSTAPAIGEMKGDNDSPDSITQLAFSHVDDSGNNVGNLLNQIRALDLILLVDERRDSIGIYQATADATDFLTWTQIDVIVSNANSTNFRSGDLIDTYYFPSDGNAPLQEAPEDGTSYARQDAGWTNTPIFNGLTSNGLTYPITDGTNGQVLTTDGSGNLTFEDAAGGGVEEAPSDGTGYVRQDGTWTNSITLGSDLNLNDFNLNIGNSQFDVNGIGGSLVRMSTDSSSSFAGILFNDSTDRGGLQYNGFSNRIELFTQGSTSTLQIQGLTYPNSDGTTGQVITTDGSGQLSFGNAVLDGGTF